MNFNDIVASLEHLSFDELNNLNNSLTKARMKACREQYDRIQEHIRNDFEQLGEAGFGIAVYNSYDEMFYLTPKELINKRFDIDIFHSADKEKQDELEIEIPNEE